MLEAREREQPGFKAAFLQMRKAREEREHCEWMAKRQAEKALVEEIRSVGEDLPAKHREAFARLLQGPLPHLAKKYRERVYSRDASAMPGEILEHLAVIHKAASNLKLALLEAPDEALGELGNAVFYAASRRPEDLTEKQHSILVNANAQDLPREQDDKHAPWILQIQGLEDLTSWLAQELGSDSNFLKAHSARETWEKGENSPEAKLFREVLRELEALTLPDIHLRPVARVVHAWVMHQTIFEVPDGWANRCSGWVKAERDSVKKAEVAILRRIDFLRQVTAVIRSLRRSPRKGKVLKAITRR